MPFKSSAAFKQRPLLSSGCAQLEVVHTEGSGRSKGSVLGKREQLRRNQYQKFPKIHVFTFITKAFFHSDMKNVFGDALWLLNHSAAPRHKATESSQDGCMRLQLLSVHPIAMQSDAVFLLYFPGLRTVRQPGVPPKRQIRVVWCQGEGC